MSDKPITREVQKATFVEGLYKALKQQAEKVVAEKVAEQKRFASIASSYINDGLEDSECVELLMIDGLSRESSESYVALAMNMMEREDENLLSYSFQFEDDEGKVWSSCDVNLSVNAEDESSAWEKAEELVTASLSLESPRILSVSRV